MTQKKGANLRLTPKWGRRMQFLSEISSVVKIFIAANLIHRAKEYFSYLLINQKTYSSPKTMPEFTAPITVVVIEAISVL